MENKKGDQSKKYVIVPKNAKVKTGAENAVTIFAVLFIVLAYVWAFFLLEDSQVLAIGVCLLSTFLGLMLIMLATISKLLKVKNAQKYVLVDKGGSVQESAPVVKSAPVVEPTPVVAPTPVVKPEPVVAPTPVAKPEPVVAPTPVAKEEPKKDIPAWTCNICGLYNPAGTEVCKQCATTAEENEGFKRFAEEKADPATHKSEYGSGNYGVKTDTSNSYGTPDQAKLEAERLEKEREEAERLERERLEKERLEKEREEAERLERERLEKERIEKEREEAERLERERLEKERLEREREEAERLEKERAEKERLEAERAAKEREEALRAERLAKLRRLEEERAELERLEEEANRAATVGSWVCNICGKHNSGRVTICTCGNYADDSDYVSPKGEQPLPASAYEPIKPVTPPPAPAPATEDATAPKSSKPKTDDIMSPDYVPKNNKVIQLNSNEWECGVCGKVNRNYVGTCSCGNGRY